MEKQKAVLYCRVARLSDEEKEKENQVARFKELFGFEPTEIYTCLLYTSDAADD